MASKQSGNPVVPNPSTICEHNAGGQALVPGVATACRMCGALLQPAFGSVNAGRFVAGAVSATYPASHTSGWEPKKGEGRNSGD